MTSHCLSRVAVTGDLDRSTFPAPRGVTRGTRGLAEDRAGGPPRRGRGSPCALGPQPVASPWGRAGTWPLPLAVAKLACASFEGTVDPLPQCPQVAPSPGHPPGRDCPAEKRGQDCGSGVVYTPHYCL